MSEPWLWITGLLTPVVLGVLGCYLYVERQARMLKTHSRRIPSGLRFDAHGWSVEVHRATQQLQVQASQGHYTRQPLDGGPEEVQEGPLTVTLPAPGLQIEITASVHEGQGPDTGKPTGLCSVVFRASDATSFAASETPGGDQHLLRLEQVPTPVAANFHRFAGQIRVWVDKLDYNLAQQMHLRAQRAEAEAAAQARAAARAEKAAAMPVVNDMDPEAQIADWRKLAGFSGISEVGYNQKGKIEWFIDLDKRGRITLHADGRTLYTTLMGATVTSLGAELELKVRDDYWTEAEPELQTFRIMKGAHSDVRRAWKERLEILCDKLRSGEISPG